MSIIDKLLVLFDDKKVRSLDEVAEIYKDYTKQVLASGLGRLAAKKWLIKNPKNKKYQITTEGRAIVSDNLANLNDDNPPVQPSKNNTIHFVFFNIPEKNRINRDIMRNFLTKNGFGRLHNTVWVSLKNCTDQITQLIAELEVEKYVHKFVVSVDSANCERILQNSQWGLVDLNKTYNHFIGLAKKYLLKKNKGPVEARNLVYHYAKILKNDPLLPDRFCPANYRLKEARKLCERLRMFCY